MRLLPIAAATVLLCLPMAACKKGPDPAIAAAEAAKNLSEGEAFLAKNAKEPGVITLPQGIQYKVITTGGGASGSPRPPRDEVKVHYEGKLLNGTVFDSSFERGVPATFPLAGLIPAWIIVLQKMHAGDEWIIWTPAHLGYGEYSKGPIPANSVLEFRIQLIDILPAAPATAQG